MPAMCRTLRALRERHLSAAMVIAADNDQAREGQEVGRNPGLIKGQEAAAANGAVLMAPSFSAEELEAGFSDWNDLATHDEGRVRTWSLKRLSKHYRMLLRYRTFTSLLSQALGRITVTIRIFLLA
jgi:hypothetical protein